MNLNINTSEIKSEILDLKPETLGEIEKFRRWFSNVFDSMVQNLENLRRK